MPTGHITNRPVPGHLLATSAFALSLFVLIGSAAFAEHNTSCRRSLRQTALRYLAADYRKTVQAIVTAELKKHPELAKTMNVGATRRTTLRLIHNANQQVTSAQEIFAPVYVPAHLLRSFGHLTLSRHPIRGIEAFAVDTRFQAPGHLRRLGVWAVLMALLNGAYRDPFVMHEDNTINIAEKTDSDALKPDEVILVYDRFAKTPPVALKKYKDRLIYFSEDNLNVKLEDRLQGLLQEVKLRGKKVRWLVLNEHGLPGIILGNPNFHKIDPEALDVFSDNASVIFVSCLIGQGNVGTEKLTNVGNALLAQTKSGAVYGATQVLVSLQNGMGGRNDLMDRNPIPMLGRPVILLITNVFFVPVQLLATAWGLPEKWKALSNGNLRALDPSSSYGFESYLHEGAGIKAVQFKNGQPASVQFYPVDEDFTVLKLTLGKLGLLPNPNTSHANQSSP